MQDVHVSIMQTVRMHLESVRDSREAAFHCILCRLAVGLLVSMCICKPLHM